jgi:hypothetical protein
MLKFGVLYLNNGIWNGERIIPGDWVEKSSIPYGNNKGIRIPIDDSGRKVIPMPGGPMNLATHVIGLRYMPQAVGEGKP